MEANNMAAMREALEDILEKIDAWRTDGTMEHWQYSQLFDICDAALAAPPEPPSNAAAMRDALEEQLRYWNAHVRTRDEEEMRKRTEAALSAPPRNCDVGTAQKQIDRFHEFCHSNRVYIDEFHGYDCRPDCPIGKIVDRDNKFCDNCWAAWAQMPFAPAEGGKE